ncbi:MAG TPA: hypothetical protein VH643_28630 [Gemmataceae bacterium]|jgi:hypothetical protein
MSLLSQRRSPRSENGLGLLVNGERMKQPEFHRRYAAYEEDEKWELIGGIVYRASPMLSLTHSNLRGRRPPPPLGLREPRPPRIAKPNRRGELLAAAVTFVRKSGKKTPSIAVPVENIFS